MTLQGEMAAYMEAHPDVLDQKALARGFLAEHDPNSLVVLLADQFAHMQRNQVRLTEIDEIADIANRLPGEWSKKMRESPYRLGTGEPPIPWGKMTVAHHITRIALLQSHIDGLQEGIELSRQAIRDIEAAGVTCLDEIPGVDG